MKVVITDPNIFIDLVHVKLLNHLFEVNLEVHSTRDIFRELNPTDQNRLQKFISSGKLFLHNCEEFDLSTITDTGFLDLDRSALCLAAHLKAFIISGDPIVMLKRKITTHGVIWLFERFIENKKITKSAAIKSLKLLLKFNPQFLPSKECERKIKAWTK